MKGKLRVWGGSMYPYSWHWEIVTRGLYISYESQRNGYTTEEGARRAALKAAARLNIEVEETK